MNKQVDLLRLRTLCAAEAVILTEHCTHRLRERRIDINDVLQCIQCGEIIEQYPEDYPTPSCLILGLSVDGKPLHVVSSIKTDMACIITAYWPNTSKWEADFKTRKAVEK